MKLNKGLVEAHQELSQSFINFEARNQARHDGLEEQIKKDKAKKDTYFSEMYQSQNARYYRVRELLLNVKKENK